MQYDYETKEIVKGYRAILKDTKDNTFIQTTKIFPTKEMAVERGKEMAVSSWLGIYVFYGINEVTMTVRIPVEIKEQSTPNQTYQTSSFWRD